MKRWLKSLECKLFHGGVFISRQERKDGALVMERCVDCYKIRRVRFENNPDWLKKQREKNG